jgi:Ca-activated chloride channel homolog
MLSSTRHIVKDLCAGIKVFTIAYGSDADFSDLTQIASATNGQAYTGSPQNIRQVYYGISQFF